MYWYCWEKIDLGHFWDLKGYMSISDLKKKGHEEWSPHLICSSCFLGTLNFLLNQVSCVY